MHKHELHTSESYEHNCFTKITIESTWRVVKSHTTITNYFITFLWIINVTNFLLIFTRTIFNIIFSFTLFWQPWLRDILLVLTRKTRRAQKGVNVWIKDMTRTFNVERGKKQSDKQSGKIEKSFECQTRRKFIMLQNKFIQCGKPGKWKTGQENFNIEWSVKHGGKNYLVQTSNVEVEVPSITVQASKLECEIINIIN